jgi:hypothetical protein
VLRPTAAIVWEALAEPVTRQDLDRIVSAAYPVISPALRHSALDEVIDTLNTEGLLERSGA